MRITKWHFPLNWNWQQRRLRISFWLAARLPVDGFSCKLLLPLFLCSPGLSQRAVMEWVTFLTWNSTFVCKNLIKGSNDGIFKAQPIHWCPIAVVFSWDLRVYSGCKISSTISCLHADKYLGDSKIVLVCWRVTNKLKVVPNYNHLADAAHFFPRSLLIVGVLGLDDCREHRHSCMFVWDGSFSAAALRIFGNAVSEVHYHPAPERSDQI